MLITEIWSMVLSFCSLIDIIYFGYVCSDFLGIIQFDKRFVNRRKLVNSLTDYGELFNFFVFQFQELSRNVRSYYRPLIPSNHNYILNIFDKRLNKIKYEIMPLKVFCHFFIVHVVLNLSINAAIALVFLSMTTTLLNF